MEASGAFERDREKDIEFLALEGSLSMMSKGSLALFVCSGRLAD